MLAEFLSDAPSHAVSFKQWKREKGRNAAAVTAVLLLLAFKAPAKMPLADDESENQRSERKEKKKD